MEAYVALIREFGFPVFVAVWFMYRLERRVDRLFELATSHMQATALLAKSVDMYRQERNPTGTHAALHAVPQDGG